MYNFFLSHSTEVFLKFGAPLNRSKASHFGHRPFLFLAVVDKPFILGNVHGPGAVLGFPAEVGNGCVVVVQCSQVLHMYKV